jgi:hypothetical protein
MSLIVSRLAIQQLRTNMFLKLPVDIQNLFPTTYDALTGSESNTHNIVNGEYQDFGVNATTPMITVHSEGIQEGIVNVWRHIDLHIDIWVGGNVAPNVDGRRFISIVYEYINKALQNVNWSGRGGMAGGDYVQIQRCYETERSSIIFEPTGKVYHLSNVYRVEAISQSWY